MINGRDDLGLPRHFTGNLEITNTQDETTSAVYSRQRVA